MPRFKVTVLVDAKDAKEAKAIVAATAANPSLDYDDAVRVERYDSAARNWFGIKKFPGDRWETSPKDLPKISKFAAREAKIERQMVRVMRGNVILAAFFSDGKVVPRKDWRAV